jgi:anti-sigma-K factor RskA
LVALPWRWAVVVAAVVVVMVVAAVVVMGREMFQSPGNCK